VGGDVSKRLHFFISPTAHVLAMETQLSTEEARKYGDQCGTPRGKQLRRHFEVAAMDIAPAPGFSALEGGNQRMVSCLEVLKCVGVLRVFAAADMATR